MSGDRAAGGARSRARLLPGARVTVRVPASSANLGPGFDSVGLALGVWDECTATVTDGTGLVVEIEGEGSAELPRDERHLVHRTMLRTWEELDVPAPAGLRLECRNGVPHGRGLGSSATAIVTGIVAALRLHDVSSGVARHADLDFAGDLASRLEGHPDNASASVFGGLTLSWTEDAPADGGPATRTVRLPIHPEVEPVLFVPTGQLSTATARSVLPAHVRLREAAWNSARAALLVHAVGHDPRHLLSATREWLHQEPRRPSYPDSMALVDALRDRGHAAVISGAGPSVLVLTTRAGQAAVVDGAARSWRALTPGVPDAGATVVAERSPAAMVTDQ